MTTYAPASHIDFEYRKRVFADATVIILCTQFQIMQMTQQDPKAENAHWNDAETMAMLDYLILHQSKLGGMTFKLSTFNDAAADLHTKNLKTQGATQTGIHCRGKWNTLKSGYTQINKYLQKSGVHWDPVVGANIQGKAAEDPWSDYVGKSSNSGMKQFKRGWRFYTKMQQILMHASAAHGAAAYNPAALAATDAATENVPVPGSSTQPGGVGAPTSDSSALDVSVVATAKDFTWGIPPLHIPAPVASTSVMAAPPVSSSVNSGKCSHNDMIFESTPPPVTSYVPTSEVAMSEAPHAHSEMDLKKLKLLVQGKKHSTIGTNKTCVTSNKGIKEAANTAALMNLQGTINHLLDSITMSFTVTDKSRVADARSHALQSMQDEEYLSLDDKLALVHAFMRSPITCSSYLNITQPELHIPFLHSILVEARQVVNLEPYRIQYLDTQSRQWSSFIYLLDVGIIV
ncbi:hypothetical protein BDR03DRAFT_985280 [Suillus americanus]|nr:hypothetical protein BDR03DRAFT_985280 [Suillus americanus]